MKLDMILGTIADSNNALLLNKGVIEQIDDLKCPTCGRSDEIENTFLERVYSLWKLKILKS